MNSQGPEQARQSHAKFRRNAKPVPGQYLVVLDEDMVGPKGENSRAAAIADELAPVHHGSVLKILKHAVQGFSVRLPEAAAALSHDPRIAFVEEDGEVHAAAVQSLPMAVRA
jgi:hypothetical protein